METISHARQTKDDKTNSYVEWNELVEIDENNCTDGAAEPQKPANDVEEMKNDDVDVEQKHSHTENSDIEEQARNYIEEYEQHALNDENNGTDGTKDPPRVFIERKNELPQEIVVKGRKNDNIEQNQHHTNGCAIKEDERKDNGENESSEYEAEQKMDAAIFQQAWDLVEFAISMQTDDIKMIAKDDIIFLAERMLKNQEDFRRRNIPHSVDIAYHHTKSENLRTIRTNGLLSRNERYQQQIVARNNGSTYGDGIYCSVDPVAHAHRYGDVTIVLARMKGKESSDRFSNQNEINTVVVPRRNLCVLKSSNQCIPLFCFNSNILSRADGSDLSQIADFHKQVQHHLLDRIFKEDGRTVLDPMEFPCRMTVNGKANLQRYPLNGKAVNGTPNPSAPLPKCFCNWRFCRTYQKAFREFSYPLYNGVVKLKFYENDPQSMALKASIDRTLNVEKWRSNDWKEVESNSVPGCMPVTSTKYCRYYIARHHFTEKMMKHFLDDRRSWDWNRPLLEGEARQFLYNLDPQDVFDDGVGDGLRRYVQAPNVPKDCVRQLLKELKDLRTNGQRTNGVEPSPATSSNIQRKRSLVPLASQDEHAPNIHRNANVNNNNHNSTALPTGAACGGLEKQKEEENHRLRQDLNDHFSTASSTGAVCGGIEKQKEKENHRLRQDLNDCKNKINMLQNTVEQLKVRLDLDETEGGNGGVNGESSGGRKGRDRGSAGKGKKTQEREAGESSFELDNIDGVTNENIDTLYVRQKQIIDPYGERGVYIGEQSRSTGMPNGVGRLEYENENRWYEGDWVHGRWTGFGKLSNGKGDFYEGGVKNDHKHGIGTMRFADGRVFEGEYIRGQMTRGKMTYQDGSIYVGQWADGMRHGRGKCTFVDGSQYVGDFCEGNIHGRGKMTWNDGECYVGNWSNGEKDEEYGSRNAHSCNNILCREQMERSLKRISTIIKSDLFFGTDLTDKLDEKTCHALNEDRRFPWQNLLSDETWKGCKSDDDNQIILHFEFNECVKIRGMKLTEFDNGSHSEQNPSKILCFQNRSNLGFEDVESVDPTTTLTITRDDLKDDSKILMLKEFKHRLTKSITLFVEENNGGCITSLGSLKFYGDCNK